jgi:hypothetical protein
MATRKHPGRSDHLLGPDAAAGFVVPRDVLGRGVSCSPDPKTLNPGLSWPGPWRPPAAAARPAVPGYWGLVRPER